MLAWFTRKLAPVGIQTSAAVSPSPAGPKLGSRLKKYAATATRVPEGQAVSMTAVIAF